MDNTWVDSKPVVPALRLMCIVLPPHLKERIDRSQMAREQIRSFRTVHLDFHPQESHLVTFKDPWSFPILYHPECNNLVVKHMEDIAEKVSSPTELAALC